MDPRRKIPALALLGLSCTECDAEPDPIVGEWLAVDIDGQSFPMIEPNDPDDITVGWRLQVEPDHQGVMAYYHAAMTPDLRYSYEYYSELTVDDGAAPRYRFTVKGDLSDVVRGDGDEPYSITLTGVDTEYSATEGYGETYGDTGDTGGDSYGSTGALDHDEQVFDEFELELSAIPRPAAAGTLILDCELAAGALTCQRVGASSGDELVKWRFEKRDDSK